mmetsp:Transcript_79724/g.159191  ORF Transcript_79724/g.159191 Transcript_79724/m.159191 type:complete len:96 (+) Transcript_79724:483-770(+)
MVRFFIMSLKESSPGLFALSATDSDHDILLCDGVSFPWAPYELTLRSDEEGELESIAATSAAGGDVPSSQQEGSTMIGEWKELQLPSPSSSSSSP